MIIEKFKQLPWRIAIIFAGGGFLIITGYLIAMVIDVMGWI